MAFWVFCSFCAAMRGAVIGVDRGEDHGHDGGDGQQGQGNAKNIISQWIRFSFLCRLLLGCTELHGTADLIQQHRAGVHAQDGIGHALAVAAEVADQNGDDAAADAVDDLRPAW